MKIKLLLFASILISSISLSFLISNSALAQTASLNPPSVSLFANSQEVLEPEAGEGDSKPASSCQVEGVGWIICPVFREMAKIVDGAYLFVASLLVVQPLMTTGSGKAIYDAWSIMRNFANVAFVIAFLMIIFSQLTSVGLNNYGIKKMLPRLIVAAILVNVSFWICAGAVDVSNILGTSINGLFDGVLTEGKTSSDSGVRIVNGTETGEGWEGIVGLVLAGTAIGVGVGYATMAALGPALVAAIVAIVTVFLVLTLRQALIILLVVISPLAFVAYLLPNTEDLFKKWMALFKTLLLMFPIIALMFGASALASTIVMDAAAQPDANGEQSPYRIAIQIMGALISIIPLALTPIVMKTAGGVLNRFGGIVNNPNKGPADKLRKKAEGYRDYRQDIARGNRLERGGKLLEGDSKLLGKKYSKRRRVASFISSAGANQAVNADKQKGFAKAVADENAQSYFAKRALGQEGFAKQITGDERKVEGLKASAQSAVDKIMQQDAANREILYTADITIRNNPKAELEKILNSGSKDEVGIKALGSMLMKGGSSGYGQFNDAITAYENSMPPGDQTGIDTINEVKKFVSDNGRDFKAKDPAMLKWAKNAGGYETLELAARNPNAVTGSDAEVASVAPDSLRKAVQHGTISVDKARAILSNPEIAGATGDDNKEMLRAVIANGGQAVVAADIKAEIANLASRAPTVEQIQQDARNQSQTPSSTQAPTVNIPPQPNYAPTVNVQPTPPIVNVQPSAPGTLNIQHPTPPNASSNNYRTSPPPSTNTYRPDPNSTSGLYVPNGYQSPPPQQPPPNPPQPPSNP